MHEADVENLRTGSVLAMRDNLKVIGETILTVPVPGITITAYSEWQDSDERSVLDVHAINTKTRSQFAFVYERMCDTDPWALIAMRGDQA